MLYYLKLWNCEILIQWESWLRDFDTVDNERDDEIITSVKHIARLQALNAVEIARVYWIEPEIV